MFDAFIAWMRNQFSAKPAQSARDFETARLEAIRRKAESNESLNRARDAFLGADFGIRQVMPHHDGGEL